MVVASTVAHPWYGMVKVCEGDGKGAPVAVSGWVLADRHGLRPCAVTLSLSEAGPGRLGGQVCNVMMGVSHKGCVTA